LSINSCFFDDCLSANLHSVGHTIFIRIWLQQWKQIFLFTFRHFLVARCFLQIWHRFGGNIPINLFIWKYLATEAQRHKENFYFLFWLSPAHIAASYFHTPFRLGASVSAWRAKTGRRVCSDLFSGHVCFIFYLFSHGLTRNT